MSTKFAPITANLLVRKGEAAPSLADRRAAAKAAERQAAIERVRETLRETRPVPAAADHPDIRDAIARPVAVSAKPRRIVVTFNPQEFERLGIAAAKKDMTRHDLVRVTMNLYLQRLAAEENARCACLGGRDDNES